MKLAIAQLGQPVLWQPAEEVPVQEITGAPFQQFLSDLRETLLSQPGVGLAAPQVFASRRVFLAAVLPPPQPPEPAAQASEPLACAAGSGESRAGTGDQVAAKEKPKPGIEVFINPVITDIADETEATWEGCLSFPELLVLVERPTAVGVSYLDAQGMQKTIRAAGFAARVILHEYDHLEGILTLDRIESPRDIIKASEIGTLEKVQE